MTNEQTKRRREQESRMTDAVGTSSAPTPLDEPSGNEPPHITGK